MICRCLFYLGHTCSTFTLGLFTRMGMHPGYFSKRGRLGEREEMEGGGATGGTFLPKRVRSEGVPFDKTGRSSPETLCCAVQTRFFLNLQYRSTIT